MVLGEVMATVAATVVAFEAEAVKVGIEAEEAGDLEIEATLVEEEVKVAEVVGLRVEVPVGVVEVLPRCTRKAYPQKQSCQPSNCGIVLGELMVMSLNQAPKRLQLRMSSRRTCLAAYRILAIFH